MNKVVRDGKVAVLYSPGYGAGWYTWHQDERLLYHPKLVELVELGKNEAITKELVDSIFPDFGGYLGGAKSLEIEWIEEGTQFRIEEYDGYESITILGRTDCLTA